MIIKPKGALRDKNKGRFDSGGVLFIPWAILTIPSAPYPLSPQGARGQGYIKNRGTPPPRGGGVRWTGWCFATYKG